MNCVVCSEPIPTSIEHRERYGKYCALCSRSKPRRHFFKEHPAVSKPLLKDVANLDGIYAELYGKVAEEMRQGVVEKRHQRILESGTMS